jgi:hypothetical protein
MKRILNVIIVVAIIVILGIILYSVKNKTPIKTDSTVFHQTSSDGKVDFKVTKSECNKKRIGSDPTYLNATGQFCIVSLTVTNSSDKDITLKAPNQIAVDQKGKKYTGDAGAMYYLPNRSWADKIAPGQTATGQFVFDLPKDKTVTKYLFQSESETTINVNTTS